MKRETIKLSGGPFVGEGKIDLVPGEKGSAKMAYIRVEVGGNYAGSIERMNNLKKLRRWCDAMIKARSK